MTDNTPNLGNKLFTLVIMADTHLNQGEDSCSSPFEVNRLANRRLRHVVRDVNRIAPDFVINLGDLIHPVPSLPSYGQAAQQFLDQTRELNCPQYLVPGNHDVGDKPISWGPAGVIRSDYIALWEEYFGEHYYAFEHQGCHFVIINAQLLNSGLPQEAQQREWLEGYLAQHRGARFFINTHYPPYMTERDEDEHYDNIAEPGRSWLLGLLENYAIEALFAGHVHNFWYHRHQHTDCYLLPSTAFVRQDYSEMYRIEAGDEGGRNDLPKLGYFQVNIYENGHACLMQRTYGAQVSLDEPVTLAPARVQPLHSVENPRAPLGFDMRQPWAERIEIPPSGALDEFGRKLVRNDYPLLALWEMGVRKMRLPLSDLLQPDVLERMQALHRFGHQFQLFCHDLPTGKPLQALLEQQHLLSGLELAFADADSERLAELLPAFKQQLHIPLYLSRLRTREDVEGDGGKYYHVINHGFTHQDESRIRALLEQGSLASMIDGLVFRLDRSMAPAQSLQQISSLCRTLELRASVHLRLSGSNPADIQDDDQDTANRLAETLCAALTQPELSVFVDTFADVDRGFFRRNGVTDRRSNPRLAFHVIKHLYAALNASSEALQLGDTHNHNGLKTLSLESRSHSFMLLLPESGAVTGPLQLPASMKSDVQLLDLSRGTLQPLQRNGNQTLLPAPLTAPALLIARAL